MTDNRRPLKIRDQRIMTRFAAWLSQRSVTPNQISVLSVLFALAGAVALVCSGQQLGGEQKRPNTHKIRSMNGRRRCHYIARD